jgi:hypothetical protein
MHVKQKRHSDTLKPGDRVAMSALWLKSTQAGHAYAKRRGTLIQIGGVCPKGVVSLCGESLEGQELLDSFAIVRWDGDARLRPVAKFNLARVSSVAFAEAPYMGKR